MSLLTLEQVIMLGTMDPQVTVRLGTQELKSIVFRSGGRAPAVNWKVTLNASLTGALLCDTM